MERFFYLTHIIPNSIYVYLLVYQFITMGAVELKNKIQAYLDNADAKVLTIVNGVFENYYKDQTVAFHPNGTPMTRTEYKIALDTAEEQIDKGDFISVEEFEQQND